MSAMDRLQALEQLVVTMQGEVPRARTAAAQAEQRATEALVLGERSEGVVDTRSLEKPRSFDDATDNWTQSKFTFLSYTGAVDARPKQAMIESEVLQESALMDSVLAARDQQVSTQLHYMLVPLLDGPAQRLLEHARDGEGLLSRDRLVAEYDLTTAGRKTSLLLKVLAQTFKGNVRGSLDEFEMKIRTYERSCREVLPDWVKIEVVQMSPEDNDLSRHLLGRGDRLTTYLPVREEVRSMIGWIES